MPSAPRRRRRAARRVLRRRAEVLRRSRGDGGHHRSSAGCGPNLLHDPVRYHRELRAVGRPARAGPARPEPSATPTPATRSPSSCRATGSSVHRVSSRDTAGASRPSDSFSTSRHGRSPVRAIARRSPSDDQSSVCDLRFSVSFTAMAVPHTPTAVPATATASNAVIDRAARAVFQRHRDHCRHEH